jgi:hypothetical protein
MAWCEMVVVVVMHVVNVDAGRSALCLRRAGGRGRERECAQRLWKALHRRVKVPDGSQRLPNQQNDGDEAHR